MYVKKQLKIRVKDVDEILEKVKKSSERLDDALKLLSVVSSMVMDLNVDIYDTVNDLQVAIRLSDTKESVASLQCVIHELEDVLNVVERLPLDVAEVQKKLSQSSE